MSYYLNLYRGEVERCDRFLETLQAFLQVEGETPELIALREHWQMERSIWQFGADELMREGSE